MSAKDFFAVLGVALLSTPLLVGLGYVCYLLFAVIVLGEGQAPQ